MRILLDTHFLIWLATDLHAIGAAERTVLTDPTNNLLVSSISLWELRIKTAAEARRGKRAFALPAAQGLAFCRDNGIEAVPLQPDDIAIALLPPLDHADPFDEMLLAHAQQLGAKLLTRDDKLLGHPLAYPE